MPQGTVKKETGAAAAASPQKRKGYEEAMTSIHNEVSRKFVEMFQNVGKVHNQLVNDLDKERQDFEELKEEYRAQIKGLTEKEVALAAREKSQIAREKRFEDHEIAKEEEYRSERKQIEELRKQLDESRRIVESLEENVSKRMGELDVLEDKLKGNEEALKKKEKEVKEREQKVGARTKQLNEMDEELKMTRKDLNMQKSEFDNQQSKFFQELKEEREANQREKQELANKVQESEDFLEITQHELHSTKEQLRKKDLVCSNLKEELPKKDLEVSNLKEELSKKDVEVLHLKEELSKKNLEVSNLKDTMSDVSARPGANASPGWLPIETYIQQLKEEKRDDPKISAMLEKVEKKVDVLSRGKRWFVKFRQVTVVTAGIRYDAKPADDPTTFMELAEGSSGQDKFAMFEILVGKIIRKVMEQSRSSMSMSTTSSMCGNN